MTKVTHLTSVHRRYDTRIFLKECQSLAKAGFSVSLIVADGLSDESQAGVKIFGVEKSSSRIDRMRNATKRVYKKALCLDSDIYHLHDPELMPVGLKLKSQGKKVIFDAHEDLPLQLLNKSYSRKWVLKLLSRLASVYESYACKKFDGVIAATPTIERKFKKINPHSISVNNYPVSEEVVDTPRDFKGVQGFCYVGGIDEIRGIYQMIEALEYLPEKIKFHLAGSFSSDSLEQKVKSLPQWSKVKFHGFVDRSGVAETYKSSFAGLVTLHPIPNYLDSLPVKMFEYMGAGLPVIASNIPLWNQIVSEESCGICVNPFKPKEIAKAVQYLYENPEKAREMGRNGQKAVEQKYNWAIEEEKLIKLYKSM